MQSSPGQRWAVGAIANGHILTARGSWVPLNTHASRAGPWWPGDVVNDRAFTGAAWVALPAGWRPDPAGRHQLRWWTGHAWTQHVMNSGVRFIEPVPAAVRPSPMAPPLPVQRRSVGFWGIVDRFAFTGWVSFWLIVAVGSAWTAWQENQPRILWLTATASANVFAYKLTGRSWREVKKALVKLPYVICGVVAVGGVWLSLHFDDPDLLKVTLIVVLIGLMVSWVIS